MKYLPLNNPCLKWETNFEAFQFLIENHIAKIATVFSGLSTIPGFLEDGIKEAWSKLDPQDQIAFFIDPDAAEIIFAAHEDAATVMSAGLNRQLEDLMAARLLETPSNYTHPRPLAWAKNKTLTSANGLRVDAAGMLHSLGNDKIQSPSAEQTDFYLSQINKAFDVIREVSPQALSLIENFTSTIHLRENPHHPNYASWSTHIGVGKISAMNFGDVAGDLAEVIDFLIHESIHNFLHLLEEQYGPFLEDEAYAQPWIKEKTVPSPWSGKKIDLGSFTHAISVWYGLAQFWIKAQNYRGRYASELTPARVQKMKDQASVGFTKERNVHLAADTRFKYLSKDFLSFSLDFQSEICHLRRGAKLA